jgi:glutathione S-transferase
MLVLYQLTVSHYCEKIRWALAHKRLRHRTKNLLPGLHAITMKRLGLKSSLPVLRDDGALIQGSGDIITHLDNAFPDRSLTPADPTLAREALEWEALADEEIGPHVRRICYHQLLEHPDIVVPLLSHGGPWYGRFLLRSSFRQVREAMRKGMQINDAEVEVSEKRLDAALDKVGARISGREFLVGDDFSRADLAVASLLAPLRMPEKYGLSWPRTLPEPVTAIMDRYAHRLTWVDHLYATHR